MLYVWVEEKRPLKSWLEQGFMGVYDTGSLLLPLYLSIWILSETGFLANSYITYPGKYASLFSLYSSFQMNLN